MYYLLDASALLNNPAFRFDALNEYYLSSDVLAELKDFESRHRIDGLIHGKLLKVSEPLKESLKKVELEVQKDNSNLSKADKSILALALDFQAEGKNFVLLTDDYSIQNHCLKLKIRFQSILRDEVKKKVLWLKKCPNCKKTFPSSFNLIDCPDCNLKLKRLQKTVK
ncbi:MAG: PIN domain-containing protein [archaeon]